MIQIMDFCAARRPSELLARVKLRVAERGAEQARAKEQAGSEKGEVSHQQGSSKDLLYSTAMTGDPFSACAPRSVSPALQSSKGKGKAVVAINGVVSLIRFVQTAADLLDVAESYRFSIRQPRSSSRRISTTERNLVANPGLDAQDSQLHDCSAAPSQWSRPQSCPGRSWMLRRLRYSDDAVDRNITVSESTHSPHPSSFSSHISDSLTNVSRLDAAPSVSHQSSFPSHDVRITRPSFLGRFHDQSRRTGNTEWSNDPTSPVVEAKSTPSRPNAISLVERWRCEDERAGNSRRCGGDTTSRDG